MLDRLRRPLAAVDAALNRWYGWRGNPLYQSGTIAVALLGVVLVTGIYLLLFYRIGAPYASVARITRELPLGGFVRSLHRYASDAALAAALVHALRLLTQRRSWGPRLLAWMTGVVMVLVLLVCGWTGYVMVWDVPAQVVAREGARLFDALPFFSEPIGRAFDGERALPGAFFFLNLFAHVALPVGVGLVLWLHVAHLARPALLPPRALSLGLVGALALASLLFVAPLPEPADALRLPGPAPYDVFYMAFLPLTRRLSPGLAWLVLGGLFLAALGVPWLTRPRAQTRLPVSAVDERSCTGCEQCWIDCPYEAITMATRSDGRPYLVARVDPERCTSCGICAGSCAPMGVGPPGRTGKDQLRRVQSFADRHAVSGRVVLIACGSGAGGVGSLEIFEDSPVYSLTCAGNLHTSVVEYLVRSGAAGVLVVSCPPRDCWNREGAVWLEQRLFHDREAELQARVDRRRVRVAHAAESERGVVAAELRRFGADLAALGLSAGETEPDVSRVCDVPAYPGRGG